MIILSKSNVTIKLISNQTDGINSDQSEIITQGFFEKNLIDILFLTLNQRLLDLTAQTLNFLFMAMTKSF